MSETMKVTGFVRDDGACGKYRISQPITKCDEQGFFKGELIWPGDSTEKILEKLEGSHVVVIPRAYDDHMLTLISKLREHEVKVVIEHDDNMLDISPWSVHYREFGTESVQVDLGDGPQWLWRNGVNIDLRENRQRIDGFKKALEMADAVQVTQPILGDFYRQFNDNVLTLPNCVDGKIWQSLPLQKSDEIRVMWSGGSSHYQDFYILKDVLPAIAKKYPEVVIMVMGCEWKALIKDIPADQYRFIDWVHTEAYPYKHASLGVDISLIPLEDNKFNRCKSHIKLIEQSFLGVPSVTSYVSPYREFYAGNNMVMVNNDDASWFEGISRLIEDEQLRKNIGKQAEICARRDFDADTNAKLWADAYYKLVSH